MKKDFSWTRSAQQYERMYSGIFEGDQQEVIPFPEAFEALKEIYLKIIADNWDVYGDLFPEHYHRAFQFAVSGSAVGIFYIELDREGEELHVSIEPYPYEGADAYVSASYEHLMGMAEGRLDDDRLFQTGQLKVEGNMAKGAELRYLIHKN